MLVAKEVTDMRTIKKLEPLPQIKKQKRVAAYARVSRESEQLLHSLSAQVSYYSSFIQKNPEWIYAGVYADTGITGTSIEKRSEFKRMIADCEAGKIDIILTKSISRFSRNALDLLETVRHLKSIGVEVRFEKERINTLNNGGEVMLTVLASFAEEESKNLSTNIKWAIRKKAEKGISHVARRCLGYEWKDDHYVIVPQEAKIVKLIFSMYIDGKNGMEIADELERLQIKGIKGGTISACNVLSILENQTYCGDMLFGREYSPNIRKHKKNRGEMPMYIAKDAHEAIISREDFAKVKERRDESKKYRGRRRTTCFSRKIFCGTCGSLVVRTIGRYKDKRYHRWTCQKKINTHGKECNRKNISENELKKISCIALGLEKFSSDIFDREISKAIIYDDRIEFMRGEEAISCLREETT